MKRFSASLWSGMAGFFERCAAGFSLRCAAFFSLRYAVTVMGLCIGLMFNSLAAAAPLRVIISDAGRPLTEPNFYRDLLHLAFSKTRETDGDFKFSYIHSGGIERDRAMLVAGEGLDVMWASVTRERAKKLRVVDIDLHKNLNSYRVLLINKDDQPLFDDITSLEQLKKMTAGSGPHWTDGIILKDNGFTITYTSSYSGLFKMLAARRFHFISRGLHEIGEDVQRYSEYGLVPEENLLLKYDVPVRYCFFVNKHDRALAERIERGLKIAQADGSFDALFRATPGYKFGEDILLHSRRKVIELHNNTH